MYVLRDYTADKMPAMEGVEIEIAHRIKSNDQNKCTVIVKLNKYKGREALLR